MAQHEVLSERTRGRAGGLGRRGVVAAAMAAVAGLLAKQAAQPEPVAAAANMQFADTSAAQVENQAHNVTRISSYTGFNAADAVFVGHAFTGNAICGVQGQSGGFRQPPPLACGVYGVSGGTNQVGVYGQSDTGTASRGVYGSSTAGIGVQGSSTSSEGVHGNSDSGLGVAGFSTSNYGMYGYSQTTNGVVGQTGGSGAALVGFTTSGIGVFGGVSAGGGGLAGYFDGPVFVKSLTVAGGPKSAAVRRRDGSHARMYCQESPEPWFEDFGTAALTNGRADVALDPAFDEVVDGADYRVFLTEIGDCGGLFVSRKGPHRFEVRSRAGATVAGTFDYRVVARRADPVGGRMERVDVPTRPEIHLPPRVPDVTRTTGARQPSGLPSEAPAPNP